MGIRTCIDHEEGWVQMWMSLRDRGGHRGQWHWCLCRMGLLSCCQHQHGRNGRDETSLKRYSCCRRAMRAGLEHLGLRMLAHIGLASKLR